MQIELQEWIVLSPAMFLYAVVAIGVAAFIRGYSGFGFSALTVTSLSLILPPAEVVTSAFMLEIAASNYMLPLVWRTVNWKVLRWLLLGVVLGTPFGITVDHETLENNTVTLRNRDDMKQIRIPVDSINDEILNRINNN